MLGEVCLMKGILTINAVFGLLASMSAEAKDITQISRYATVENKPLAAQINPLIALQQVHFPKAVTTIGQALEYWMHYSGFSLVETGQQSDSLQSVLKRPLPQVLRALGPLTVKDGAEVLVGKPVFSLTENFMERTINFKLKQAYVQGKKA